METVVDVFEERSKKMDTTDLEAITEQQDVSKEEAAVETVTELED
jgi:hypothetical protein